MSTPLTPQQAIENFKLFLELSARNSYKDYRDAVREIAQGAIDQEIEGDNQHRAASGTHHNLRA